MRVMSTSIVRGGGRRLFLLDALHAAVAHRIRDGHRACTVVLADKLAVDERELVRGRIGERRIRHLLCQAQQLTADRLGGRGDALRPPRIPPAVVTMPFATEAAIHDPPSTGDCGRLESPSLMLMLSSGNPSESAATCAMMV